MSYLCNTCTREFKCKQNLEQHIKKNACKVFSNECKYCNKKFTSASSMYRHIRSNCPVKKTVDEEKKEILGKLVENQETTNKRLEALQKRNEKLEQQVEFLKNQQKGQDIIVGNSNSNSNNNNSNSNNNSGSVVNNNNSGPVVNSANNVLINNITLVGYGKEDLSKLSKSDILKVLQNGYYSTLKLTETVHFNPKYPENHNIYISNMTDKYAMMFDGKEWNLITKEDLINQIYEDKKNYIEENLDEFINSLSVSRKKALERWLDTDDEDPKIKEIKGKIKLLLYNSRKLVCDTSNTQLKIVNDGKKAPKIRKLIKHN